mgnify:CR=1 FL=1
MNKWMLWGLVSLGLLAVVCVVGAYIGSFNSHEIGGPSDWAQFGDYVGGVANPLLGFVTIALLVISLKYQADELAATRAELSQSREAMQKANVLHNNNIIIQSRNNLREQLEAHYTGTQRAFFEGMSHKYTIPLLGGSVDYSLNGILELRRFGPDLGSIAAEVKKRSEEWKGEGLSRLASEVRRSYLDCVEALIALIEYSDSDLTIALSIKNLDPLTDIMRISYLYDDFEFSGFKEKIDLAIQKRKAMPFPEFHKKTRAL